MRVLFAGAGAAEVLSAGEVRALAAFAAALYVESPAGVAALIAPGVQAGPIHAGLDGRPPRAAAGDAVAVELAGMRPWTGWLPEPAALRAATPLVLEVLTPLAERSAVPELRASAALAALDGDDLPSVAAAVGGAGPGLTPAGDDALAGLLLALRALGGNPQVDLARVVATTAISAAFLSWAARGQSLQCVHDLLTAAAAEDAGATHSAARVLGAVGHTSGCDIALGICWGFGHASTSSQAVHRKGSVPPNLTRR